jgi:NADPH:quinone reductase-like Zn-dependent oxidoreductase
MPARACLQALEPAKLGPGKRVLVQSGAGGVGHIAVQLAKAKGCYVVTVVGPKNVEFAKSVLGADEVVDYSTQDFFELYKEQPFDAVLDLMGGEAQPAAPCCCSLLLLPAYAL